MAVSKSGGTRTRRRMHPRELGDTFATFVAHGDKATRTSLEDAAFQRAIVNWSMSFDATLHRLFANPDGSSACARFSQRSPQDLNGRIHIFCTRGAAERHAKSRARASFVEAEREQHVRR